MEASRRVELQAAVAGELPLRLQRELWQLVDAHWSDDPGDDGTALAEAVAQWAFDRELLYLPDNAELARQGLRYYPVTPHTIRPVWLVRPAPAPGERPAPTTRPPSLRELGAEPIEREHG